MKISTYLDNQNVAFWVIPHTQVDQVADLYVVDLYVGDI